MQLVKALEELVVRCICSFGGSIGDRWRGEAAFQERVRGDDVYGDAEGLRVLRGAARDAQIACEAESRSRSRRHRFSRRSSSLD
jgi:hypothetical protein